MANLSNPTPIRPDILDNSAPSSPMSNSQTRKARGAQRGKRAGHHNSDDNGDASSARSISPHAVTVRPKQMAEMLNCGPTKCAELIRTGAVESVLVGKTRLITVRSIIALAHGEAA